MSESIAVADQLFPLSCELHRFVTNLQKPRLADGKWAGSVRQRCQELSEKVSAARASVEEQSRALRLSLERISSHLRAYAQELEENRNISRLKETYRSLSQGYELLRVELERYRKQYAVRDASPLRRLKTTNYARNIFHMVMGLTGVLLYEYVLTHRQTSMVIVSLCTLFLTLEALRRFFPRWNDFMVDRLFGAISRPWERHQVNSSTWYAIGLAVVTVFFPKLAAQVGVLVLAFGDPVATLVGKAWGRRKLWKEKSFIGSGAFVLASFVVTSAFLFLVPNGLAVGSRIALALSVSLGGAVAELFSDRVDDNLTIPILCAEITCLWLVF
jgi:dolichol kinase